MIFEDVNELRACLIEIMEEHLPIDSYLDLLSEIDKIKSLDLNDETKQNLCNGEIRKVLIKNNIVRSYKVLDWLSDRREEFLELMDYIKRDNEWKTKHNIVSE